jgi:hypothetical protein
MKGSPTVQMLKRNVILDLFFGQNGYHESPQNVIKAIKLCSLCDHPLAQWLSGVFYVYVDRLKTYADVKNVLLRLSYDARALFFLSRFEYPSFENISNLLEESYRLGFKYANIRLIALREEKVYNVGHRDELGYVTERYIKDVVMFASDGDRIANYLLSKRYSRSYCMLEKQEDLRFRKVCIKLGCLRSMIDHFKNLDPLDPLGVVLLGKISVKYPQYFVRTMIDFYSIEKKKSLKLDFVYGRYLKGHIDPKFNEIHRVCIVNNKPIQCETIHLAQSLVDGYDKLLKESIKSIDAWSLCAKHYLGVCKDIRLKIAGLLWYDAYEWTNSLENL